MNLRYCLQGAYSSGVTCHPGTKLKSLGIGYRRYIGQSIGDQIWLIDCNNVPDILPEYITELDGVLPDYIKD
jgi:hypothetical protein